MNATVQEVLGATFLEVVEQLTFMFGAPVTKRELPRDGSDWIAVHMDFKGDLVGQLTLSVPRDVCREIAANILGLDEDDEESELMGIDSLKEVLNQVCGHVIRGIAGDEAQWDLNTPVVEDLSEDQVNQLFEDEDTVGFMLDDHAVLLGLHTEGDCRS